MGTQKYKQPDSQHSIVQKKQKQSKQAPVGNILQTYKDNILKKTRTENNDVIQRTDYDDEIDPNVWTTYFDNKHFARTLEEAVTKSQSRLKNSAYKTSGARPSSNSVIVYDKNLLFSLKEGIVQGNVRNKRISFNASVVVDISAMGMHFHENSTVIVLVDENMKICHLEEVRPSKTTFYPAQSKVVKLDSSEEESE